MSATTTSSTPPKTAVQEPGMRVKLEATGISSSWRKQELIGVIRQLSDDQAGMFLSFWTVSIPFASHFRRRDQPCVCNCLKLRADFFFCNLSKLVKYVFYELEWHFWFYWPNFLHKFQMSNSENDPPEAAS
jgi:hypothetical protein